MNGNTYKGKYIPKNIEKYKGNIHKITYRSSWELHMFNWLDKNPSVKKWNSEEIVIQYFQQMDQKKRRYFMDLYVEFIDGSVYLFEIKPGVQTKQPQQPKRLTEKTKQRYISEIYTWKVNQDKWLAANEICKRKGWHFKILTEVHLKKYFGMKI